MNTRHSALGTLTTLVCAAALTLAGCGGSSGNAGNLAQFCKDNLAFGKRYNSLDDDLAVYDASTRAELKGAAVDIRKLAVEAPSDIRKDVSATADYIASVANHPPTEAENDAGQAIAERVSKYVNKNCAAAAKASGKQAASNTTTTIETPDTSTIDTSTFDTDPPDTSTFDTTPVASIEMPNVVNSTVDDAEAQLSSAGITGDPVIVEQKDATVAPGLVVDQDPSAGTDLTADDTVTLTVSALPDQAYLSDFQASDGQFRTGVASIKGVPYTHGVLQSQGAGYSPQKTTFTLSSHYTRLEGVVGLDDSFTGGASVQVEIFDQDNKSLFKKTVKVGVPATIDIPVTGAIQISLEATDLLTNESNSGTVVWGDLQVISGS